MSSAPLTTAASDKPAVERALTQHFRMFLKSAQRRSWDISKARELYGDARLERQRNGPGHLQRIDGPTITASEFTVSGTQQARALELAGALLVMYTGLGYLMAHILHEPLICSKRDTRALKAQAVAGV